MIIQNQVQVMFEKLPCSWKNIFLKVTPKSLSKSSTDFELSFSPHPKSFGHERNCHMFSKGLGREKNNILHVSSFYSQKQQKNRASWFHSRQKTWTGNNAPFCGKNFFSPMRTISGVAWMNVQNSRSSLFIFATSSNTVIYFTITWCILRTRNRAYIANGIPTSYTSMDARIYNTLTHF